MAGQLGLLGPVLLVNHCSDIWGWNLSDHVDTCTRSDHPTRTFVALGVSAGCALSLIVIAQLWYFPVPFLETQRG